MAKSKNDELADIKLPAPGSTPKDARPIALFKFLNPLGGEIFEVGSAVAIYWTGGPHVPQKVLIYLVDVTAWQIIETVIALHNESTVPGLFQWTIPVSLSLNHTHTFQFYIEDVPRTTWTYGPIFKIT